MDIYYNKYMKYKSKYLNLKESNMRLAKNRTIVLEGDKSKYLNLKGSIGHLSEQPLEPYLNISKMVNRIKKYGLYLVKFLRSKITPLKLMTVLELGCGNGRLTYGLAPYVSKIYGVDPSDPMLEDAEKNRQHFPTVQGKVEFLKGTSENIPLNPSTTSLDLIIFGNSLHFSEEPLAALNNVWSYTKLNGYIFIIEPYLKFADKRITDKKFLREDEKHLFNKVMYDDKQLKLKRARDSVDSFISENVGRVEEIYREFNDKKFWVILRKVSQ